MPETTEKTEKTEKTARTETAAEGAPETTTETTPETAPEEGKPRQRRGRKPKPKTEETAPTALRDGTPVANRQKMKILKLVELLRSETDPDHPMLTRDIVKRLGEMGITCDRRTLASDVAILNEYGYTVGSVLRGHEKSYYMNRRDFSVAELKILINAVQAAKFITPDKTEELIDKIADLGSSHRAEILKDSGEVRFDVTVKHSNESIFTTVTVLEEAIQTRRRASYRYFDLDENAKRIYRHEGGRYCVDPLQLVMDNGNYYLVAYSNEHGEIRHYRLDRMDQATIEAEPLSPEGAEAWGKVDNDAKVFGMFSGTPTDVVLEFDAKYIGAVQDRFGEKTKMIRTAPGRCIASVRVQAAPTVLGWIFQFVGDEKDQIGMRILSPDSLAAQYRDFARKVVEG